MIEDIIEESELFCDDIYLDSHKKLKSKKLSVRNPANLEKARSNILTKVRQLPISRQSAEILYKQVLNHKILDIVKVLKIGKKSVTIHAKANIEHKIFEKLKNTDNVIIKVYNDPANAGHEIIAYSKNIHNEEKEPNNDPYPKHIETDRNFLYEKMVIYQLQNIVIMKMLDVTKSIAEVIKENMNRISEIFREILQLFVDVKDRDMQFWQNDLCGAKHVVWCNDKWIILGTINKNKLYTTSENDTKIISNALIDIINIFNEHGMSFENLEKVFSSIFASTSIYSWNWKGSVHSYVLQEYFRFKEVYGKIPRRYIKTRFPKQSKQSKKKK
ncbi:hypothetical protein PVAND_006935 [Polypedilum vanderplanki]|uniref:Uncharacterized protein n=1 Tax=Polypedilum vanderplanki TaxID=319348 RepID=A0A9J6C4T9_POLVA|nr:hypothetical protein PVAND_006935 [Polypedilum vanderplanki]